MIFHRAEFFRKCKTRKICKIFFAFCSQRFVRFCCVFHFVPIRHFLRLIRNLIKTRTIPNLEKKKKPYHLRITEFCANLYINFLHYSQPLYKSVKRTTIQKYVQLCFYLWKDIGILNKKSLHLPNGATHNCTCTISIILLILHVLKL